MACAQAAPVLISIHHWTTATFTQGESLAHVECINQEKENLTE